MKIFLISHSETKESLEKIILGHLDGNLSEKGILEAQKIGEFLKQKSFGIKKIFSSDLKRTKDTAIIINNFLKLELNFLEILRERKAGISEGKKERDINWKTYETKFLPYRKHFGGESFLDVRKRAEKFFQKFCNQNEDILIITHSVFILMFLSFFQKKSVENSLKVDIKDKMICVNLENKKVKFIDLKKV